MAAQVFRVQRVAHVAHGGLALGAGLQLDLLVDGEAGRCGIAGQPLHGRHRRLVDVQVAWRPPVTLGYFPQYSPKKKTPASFDGAGEVSIPETGRQVMKSAPASP